MNAHLVIGKLRTAMDESLNSTQANAAVNAILVSADFDALKREHKHKVLTWLSAYEEAMFKYRGQINGKMVWRDNDRQFRLDEAPAGEVKT